MPYAEDVGERLRQLRLRQGLSLQDVERKSAGDWKAAVIGSYERGDRNISATRLCQLAEFYGVQPSDLLPEDEASRVHTTGDQSVVVDLKVLSRTGDDFEGVRRYCESIQVQRGDYNQNMLSVRTEDLRAIAIMMGIAPEDLIDRLRAIGALLKS